MQLQGLLQEFWQLMQHQLTSTDPTNIHHIICIPYPMPNPRLELGSTVGGYIYSKRREILHHLHELWRLITLNLCWGNCPRNMAGPY
jgi:hypothetical protein